MEAIDTIDIEAQSKVNGMAKHRRKRQKSTCQWRCRNLCLMQGAELSHKTKLMRLRKVGEAVSQIGFGLDLYD
jgi:hypothetical protein